MRPLSDASNYVTRNHAQSTPAAHLQHVRHHAAHAGMHLLKRRRKCCPCKQAHVNI